MQKKTRVTLTIDGSVTKEQLANVLRELKLAFKSMVAETRDEGVAIASDTRLDSLGRLLYGHAHADQSALLEGASKPFFCGPCARAVGALADQAYGEPVRISCPLKGSKFSQQDLQDLGDLGIDVNQLAIGESGTSAVLPTVDYVDLGGKLLDLALEAEQKYAQSHPYKPGAKPFFCVNDAHAVTYLAQQVGIELFEFEFQRSLASNQIAIEAGEVQDEADDLDG